MATCSSSTANTNNLIVNSSLRTHRTLQTVLSPESSILSGLSRVVSVQEREVQQQSSATFFNGGNSIYADPQFDYQDQCIPECELSNSNVLHIKGSHEQSYGQEQI